MGDNKVVYTLSLKDYFTGALQKAEQQTEHFEGQIKHTESVIQSFAKGAALAIAGISFANVIGDIVETRKQVQGLTNAFDLISGGNGSQELQYVTDFANSIGADAPAIANGYKTISGAAMGTSLAGIEAKRAFEGVSMAAQALGLSSDDANGALMALGQMISKGKVQAEELRGQLGERIPGAFQIAAASMGMTTAQLDDFMQQGKLTATQFIPAFAQALKERFGDAAGKAAESIAGMANRMNNDLFVLKDTFGKQLEPAIKATYSAAIWLIDAMKGTVEWVGKNKDVIAIAASGLLVYATYTNWAAISTGVLSSATTVATAAQWLLNAAMSANPIGVLILAVTGLAAGVVYAWKHFAGFRGAVMGAWEVLKNLTGFIKDFVINVFSGLADVVAGVFTLDGDQIQRGLNTAVTAYANFGKSAAQSFSKGYSEGLALFAADNPKTPYVKPAGDKQQPFTPQAMPQGMGAGATKVNGVQGQKVTTINISIGKLVDTQNIYTEKITQSYSKIKEEINRALLDAVNDSQIVAGY